MPNRVDQHAPDAARGEVTGVRESDGGAESVSRPSFRIETHGCKLNMADSQVLAGQFLTRGFRAGREDEEPNVYVVNTCTVTAVADKKARQAISSARRRFPEAIVVAAGCYPERDPAALDALQAVDLIYGNRDKAEMVGVVSGILGRQMGEIDEEELNSAEAPISIGRSRAAVKIQEGCDQVCAYCIVPRVRGRERSVSPDEIVGRVDALSKGGCPEVVLTGTQLGTYGFDLPGMDLRDLIVQVLTRTDIRRLRVSSLQPQELTEGLLDVWGRHGGERLAPHFHMPLQSGSDAVLARMRRRYTSAEYEGAVSKVRNSVPGASITTDVICGFPGETEEDHENTLAVMRRVGFADAHVFPYSSRPGTSAAHFEDHVDSLTKANRAAEARAVAAESAASYRRAVVGERRTVLWEGERGRSGLTEDYLRATSADPALQRAAADRNGSLTDASFEQVEILGVREGVLLTVPA